MSIDGVDGVANFFLHELKTINSDNVNIFQIWSPLLTWSFVS